MFKSIEDVISKYDGEFNLLNYANGLIIKKNIVAELSCSFDYDMNDYDKHNEQCHYFTGCYKLFGFTSKVLSVKLGNVFLANDSLQYQPAFIAQSEAFENEHGYMPTTEEVFTQGLVLDETFQLPEIHPDLCEFIIDNDDMKSSDPYFNKVEITGLDHMHNAINYHGTLYGDSSGLDIIEYHKPFMHLHLECSNSMLPFYKELLLDAYINLQNKNYKMCAFLAYAAFESFVNIVSKREYKKERLINKFKYTFKLKKVDGNNLNTFDCYTKLLNFYNDNGLSKYRDMIAHGKEDYDIWSDTEGADIADKMFVFTSLSILFYERSMKNLQCFNAYMKSNDLKPHSN